MAWILRLPISGIRTRIDGPGVVFVTEDRVANMVPTANGGPASPSHRADG